MVFENLGEEKAKALHEKLMSQGMSEDDAWTEVYSVECNMDNEETLVQEETVYSTQGYCEKFLDFYPMTDGDKDELRDLLDHNGYKHLRDYPLSKIERIIKDGAKVVLVDTSYVGLVDGEYQTISEYKWVEIPEE